MLPVDCPQLVPKKKEPAIGDVEGKDLSNRVQRWFLPEQEAGV